MYRRGKGNWHMVHSDKMAQVWCIKVLADCHALQRLTDYSEGLLFASESRQRCIVHIRGASFTSEVHHSRLVWAKVQLRKDDFTGLQGKSSGSLEYFHQHSRPQSAEIKAAVQPQCFYPRAAARYSQLSRIGFALKCQWCSPMEKLEKKMEYIFCSTHLQNQMEWIGF